MVELLSILEPLNLMPGWNMVSNIGFFNSEKRIKKIDAKKFLIITYHNIVILKKIDKCK